VVRGTVSIALEDYHKLIDSEKSFQNQKGLLLRTTREMEVLLSFLASRSDIDKHVQEFNNQSKTSEITFEGNRAKIQFKHEEKDNDKDQ
jgi:hypothetical protein